MNADRERARDLRRRQHRADREAAAQPLGARQDVRDDAFLHVREQRAGAAHAALDLVEDQQRVVLVAEPARRGQEFRRARNHAAFALHRLEDHGADVVAAFLGERRFEAGDVVVADVGESRGTRAESVGVLGLAARGDGEERPAVEGVERRDDAKFLRAEMIVRVAARELERRFVRLGAGVAEEHALRERRIDQFFRQPQRRLVGHPVGDVPDGLRLIVQRLDHRRVAVTERGDRDAAGEVDVHAALLVPHARSDAAHGDERRRRVTRHHELVEHRARHRQRSVLFRRRLRFCGDSRGRNGGRSGRRDGHGGVAGWSHRVVVSIDYLRFIAVYVYRASVHQAAAIT